MINVMGDSWVFNYTFSEDDLNNPERANAKPRERTLQELLSILARLHQIISDATETEDIRIIADALNECQSAALQIGTLLEETAAGDFSETVSMLEEYCELAYRFAAQALEA